MINKLIEDELYEVEKIERNMFFGETEEQQKEKYKITDIESANWAFRKLRAIQEKENDIKKLAEKEIERIKAWQEKELETLNNSKSFFEGLLSEYFIKEREKDPKFKISTPYGKVSARKQQPKWNYDEDKLIEWLKENDMELVRVKYEPNKTEIKKRYKVVGNVVTTEDGEIVEGITVEEQPDAIAIKVVE